MKHLTSALLAAPAALIPFGPVLAQDESHPHPGDDFHGAIVVTAPGLERLDLLAGTSVVEGEELQRNQAGQLGDVLAKLPGVSASGFAPGVSRPVLRGFDGDRVRVLEDGIGSSDASGASADHAVTIDPLLTDRIEVLRGPAVLLYGSQAIGGAVNVIGKRIPPRVPDEVLHLDAQAALDTAYDRREIGASADMPLGPDVAFHLDGSWRRTGDVSVPGYVASEHLRAELLEHAEEEEEEGHHEEADEFYEAAALRDRLPNSWTESWSAGAGIALFSGESNIGLSFGYYDTRYGVPGLPGVGHVHGAGDEEDHDHDHDDDHDHEDGDHDAHGHGDVSIGMKKYRVDLRGVLDLGDGFFDRLQTRWGWSDYTHTEFEGDEIGTVFDVGSIEGRLELVQSRRGGWSGSLGAQYSRQSFEAVGEEAFIPPNSTEQIALFALQEIAFDPLSLQLGARYEHTDVGLKAGGMARSFGSFSAALGLSLALSEALDAGVNLSRATRAPTAQELFADGPHIATQQYELGDPLLGKEAVWGVEGWLRGSLGPARLSLAVYRNSFDGFIYLAHSDAEEDGLDVFEFRQQDARHFGVEGEVSLPLFRADGFALLADLRGDYVRATLADGSPAPRIPPLSLLGALEARTGHFDARAEVQWFAAQNRTAQLEEPTGGFAQVNLSLAWHPFEGRNNLTLMLQADNIFDAEGRRHTSYTKEFVPLAGRNVRLSARASF